MVYLGILDGEMYSHSAPHQVAVDYLYLILSVAHSSALPDELQHHLNVLHVGADGEAEDAAVGVVARDTMREPGVHVNIVGLDDVLDLGTVSSHCGARPYLLGLLPEQEDIIDIDSKHSDIYYLPLLMVKRKEPSDLSLLVMDIDIGVVSIHSGCDAVSKIIEKVGVVVGARHEVSGHIIQHCGLVRVDRVLV